MSRVAPQRPDKLTRFDGVAGAGAKRSPSFWPSGAPLRGVAPMIFRQRQSSALSVLSENRRCAEALAKAQEAKLREGSLPLAARAAPLGHALRNAEDMLIPARRDVSMPPVRYRLGEESTGSARRDSLYGRRIVLEDSHGLRAFARPAAAPQPSGDTPRGHCALRILCQWAYFDKLSSSKFGWLIPQQVILSVAKDLDGQGDSSLRSE